MIERFLLGAVLILALSFVLGALAALIAWSVETGPRAGSTNGPKERNNR